MKVIYTPDDEPYLGLPSVYRLDRLITKGMQVSTAIAKVLKLTTPTELQKATIEIAPGALSVALSIRELVRQGYLLSGFILLRPLMERAATLAYLADHPDTVSTWKDGWQYGTRPTLRKRVEALAKTPTGDSVEAVANAINDATRTYNALVHGCSFGVLEGHAAVTSLVAGSWMGFGLVAGWG